MLFLIIDPLMFLFNVSNAYMKKSQKVSKRDLEKARNMKKAYADRIKEGIYYEKN